MKPSAVRTKGVPWIAWLLFAAALAALLMLFWFIANLEQHARGRKGGHAPKDAGSHSHAIQLCLAMDQLR